MLDDDTPGLGVDFVIDAGDSFGEMARLAAAMESTEVKVASDAKRMRDATRGMIDLGGATASVQTFANAATRELAAAARESRAAEKAGEAMVRQLERQNAAYGKTREELRSMRAEERALAAERTQNTDLATRIREAEQALYDKEFAAARKARIEAEELAEAKMAAAEKAAVAAAQEAQALREAAHAHALFEAAARKGMEAYREEQAAQRALDREREAQEVRSAALAYAMFEAAARRGAQALREHEAAERAAAQARASEIASAESYAARLEAEAAAIGKTADELRALDVARRAAAAESEGHSDQAERIRAAGAAYAEARKGAEALEAEQRRLADAERDAATAAREAAAAQAAQDASIDSLRASVDPLYATQQRLRRELENAARLYRAGAIQQDEYARSAMELAGRLDEVQRAQARAAEGADDVGKQGKLGANDLTNIAFQIQDIIVSLQGGQKPLTVLMQQGSQLGGIMMQTGASVKDMAGAIIGLAIVSRPSAAAIAALTEAQTALAAAETAAGSAGARAAITSAELAVAEENAARAGILDVAAQQALAAARLEAASAAEVAAAANRQLAGAQASVTASSEASAASATRMLAPWASASLAVLAPLAVVGVGIKRWQDQLANDAGLKKFADGLGLTHREMKKLGDVSVTVGDLLAGVWKSINDAFGMKVSGKTIVDWLFGPNDMKQIQGFVSQIYGVFVGGFSAIVELWSIIVPTISHYIGAIVNFAMKIFQPIVDAAKWAADGVVAVFRAVYDWASGWFKTLSTAVSPLLRMFGSAETASALDNVGSQLGKKVTSGFTAAVAPLGTIGGKIGEVFGRQYSKAAGDFVSGTNAVVDKIGESAVDAAQRRLKEKADKIKADRTPKTDRHAEQLARESEAIEAQIRNLYALADAYRVSGAQALIAEARVKAESAAIKKRGDIEAMVDQQVRLAIAQRVADAEKSTAGMRDQAAAQTQVNAMVAAGLVPAERAAVLVQQQISDLPLLAAIEAARARGQVEEAKRATAALVAQRKARADLDEAGRTAAFNTATATGNTRLAELREEARLIGATSMERAKGLALVRATAEAEKFNPADRAAYIAQQIQIAEQTEKTAAATRNWNAGLTETADRWDLIARNVQNAATGMADAFGKAGRAIGDMASIYAGFHATEARLQAERDAKLREAGDDQRAQARANTAYELSTATLRIGALGDMATAAKGYFDEQSKGYAALTIAEKAFRAVEFALSLRATAQDAIETSQKIAKSVARTAAKATEAVVSAIAGLPFPLNLAAGAATVAALASLGVSLVGSFAGGKSQQAPTNTGTGTVLGDTAGKSGSIKRSIDALKDVDTLTSTYAREMMGSLRSIDNQIGGLASVLVRAGNINASAGVTEGFQKDFTGKLLATVTGGGLLSKLPVVGGIFGAIGNAIGSLFGSTTSVVGNGLSGKAQSVGSILSGGFDAEYYSEIEKKKRFLGITTGKSYSTQYAAADPGLANQFTLLLRSFNDSIVAAAGPLGASTGAIQDRLNAFVLDIGKIDLKGLTGKQVEEKLTAVFGAAADRMADAAFPGLQRFAKVGEGAFETLVRVASTVEAVTNALGQLGNATAALGIDAKMGLAAQFDSIGAMTSATDAYFRAYYSQTEQAAARTAQLGRVFGSMGLTMPSTLAGFRALVEAQDLTTAAGQATYAALLKLAPAFADLQSAMAGAKSAADIASERADLQRRILELRSDTAALRALDLAKIDPSNRPLQEQIYAIQDAQEAARAADELRQAWTSVGDSIMDEVKRIRGLSDAGGQNSFASLQGEFNAANQAARGGDMDAAKGLPALSQALLGKAADVATSRQELARIQAATAAALEATYGIVGSLSGSKKTTSTTATVENAAASTRTGTAQNSDAVVSEIKSLKEEVAQLRSENNSGNAAIAGNTARTAKKLDDVTSEHGGTAVSVAAAA